MRWPGWSGRRSRLYNRAMHLHSPPSFPEVTSDCPCTGHCTTALGDDVCRSCQRTLDEVTRWPAMSEDERREVNYRIALVRQSHLTQV